MLTTKIWRSIHGASKYYIHLKEEEKGLNYYLDQEPARLYGKLAERLGVEGKVLDEKTFSDLLAGNIDDHQLRLRQKDGARCGYDFCISVPKSISLVYEFTKDPAIKGAIDAANKKMIEAIQDYAQYQSNSATERHYHFSGEIMVSSFFHATSRPSKVVVDGKDYVSPDPNYHYHNFIFAHTYNKDKGRYQALELGDQVYRRLPYFEKLFHSYLSTYCKAAGYDIERTAGGGFELAGIDRSIIEKFSNRTISIEAYAKDHQISDPKEKGSLGVKLRLSKNATTVKPEDLQDHWKSRLDASELKAIQNLKGRDFAVSAPLSARECLERALAHHLEREAAAPMHNKIEATALTYGYGSVLPEDIKNEIRTHPEILRHDVGGLDYLTTRTMHRAEERLITLAADGKGRMRPVDPHFVSTDASLNAEQEKAVRQILEATDRCMIFRGSAGTGKSRTLNTVKHRAGLAGKSCYAITPSTAAAKVLSDQGFEATTIARFLLNTGYKALNGQILVVDEAGQCGLKDLTQILELSKQYGFKTILSGDTRQHSPVTQEALSILETQAKLKTVTLNKIMRQQDNVYRNAIQKLSRGDVVGGYNDLDKKLGGVHEVPESDNRIEALGDAYVSSVTNGRKALIISPTHYEGEIITETVRAKLKDKGVIRGRDHKIDRLDSLNYTATQKQDPTSYTKGMVVRFIRNHKNNIQAGSHYEVQKFSDKSAKVGSKDRLKIQLKNLKTGSKTTLPFDAHEHFDVFQKSSLPLAVGDPVRLTQNGKTLQGTRVNNGNTYRVERITKSGIKLDNGKTLPKDFYHLKSGIVETSHGSQGKTADDVFISMSDISQAAVTDQTLYVAASRGKYSCQIFTSCKTELKRAVQRSGRKITAGEIARGHKRRELERKQQRVNQSLIAKQDKPLMRDQSRRKGQVKGHGPNTQAAKNIRSKEQTHKHGLNK